MSQLKRETEDYIRVGRDIENENRNKIIDRKEILLSLDKKNTKMIKNRMIGYIATLGSENLKGKSFYKFKLKMKTMFEDHLRSMKEKDL